MTLENKNLLQSERVRADQIDEQRCVAELRNELLTEMVAAEQVTTCPEKRSCVDRHSRYTSLTCLFTSLAAARICSLPELVLNHERSTEYR